MRWPISAKRVHPADPMIPDVSTATGANSKSATSHEYFCLCVLLIWRKLVKKKFHYISDDSVWSGGAKT